ncbi:MAG: DUF4474 domain-containing protein [Lachnospiraceae bacterium]|nr:DUF4474 domain-containing protein [Lachnospiraceae bacterium]MCI9149018.1 DUF4474 domain-containing protein [Lachnospiraceae bacterium]
MEYAFLILLFYILLTILGVMLYEHLEQRRLARIPVQLPVLNDREKQAKLNELIEPFGFAYDGRQNIFYSRMDSWQRKYGYGRMFDEAAAPLNMIIDCEPVYFEYKDKRWLIEFWKGQYGIATGAEVGVYYLPKEKLWDTMLLPELFYQSVSDEDTLAVQFVLWKKGRGMFLRRGYHWWLTGFSLGEYSNPKDLVMDIEITLPEAQMRDAFLMGLQEAGYTNEEISIVRNTVWIHFTKPHTRQPITRGRLFSRVKQWENRRNCRLFAMVTADYTHAYDKLMALKARMPLLYHKLEGLGRNRFASGDQ